MTWPLLWVLREEWKGDIRWGTMYLRALPTGWERLCYSYELPWREDQRGRSTSSKSCIELGTYAMRVRQDGPKRWRLELKNTAHRGHIQVHRAAPNLFIKGCILPIHFRSDNLRAQPAAREENRVKSIALMGEIRKRYDLLREVEPGDPSITIAATLPAVAPTSPPSSMTA